MPPSVLTLYTPDRHNRGVLTYSFSFVRTIENDDENCNIYKARCAYDFDKMITVALESYGVSGFFHDPEQAYAKCVDNQREAVKLAEQRLEAERAAFDDLSDDVMFFTPTRY